MGCPMSNASTFHRFTPATVRRLLFPDDPRPSWRHIRSAAEHLGARLRAFTPLILPPSATVAGQQVQALPIVDLFDCQSAGLGVFPADAFLDGFGDCGRVEADRRVC